MYLLVKLQDSLIQLSVFSSDSLIPWSVFSSELFDRIYHLVANELEYCSLRCFIGLQSISELLLMKEML